MDKNNLRPTNLEEFFGQKNIVNELKVYIFSAKKLKKPLSHVLLIGPSGMGKTSLAYVISYEMKSKIKVINAPMIDGAQDLVEILATLKENDILFIDEIHRLDKKVEEILYSVMDDFIINVPYKSNEKTKLISIEIPHFTLIGATTLEGIIATPFRERFTFKFHFDNYSKNELKEILLNDAKKIDLNFASEEATFYFVNRTKNNPRILISILKKLKDYSVFHSKQVLDLEFLEEFFKFIRIDDYGLTDFDKKIIAIMYENFPSQSVSLESISSLLNENVSNIRENYEPYLVNIGLIKRTRSGRCLTELGKLFYWNNIKP